VCQHRFDLLCQARPCCDATTISHVCGVIQLIQSSSELSKRLPGIGAPFTVEERACERLVN